MIKNINFTTILGLICAILWFPGNLLAETIKGIVIDSGTRKPLPEVEIHSDTGQAVQTDEEGRFALHFKKTGGIALTFTKSAYTALTDRFFVEKGKDQSVTIELNPVPVYEDELVVATTRIPEVESVEFITPDYVINAPGAFEDTLQSLQVMPGVISNNDYMARLFIRGGRPDQNGIFLDNIAVYDPYRLFGLTSLFNPETIKDVRLYPGGFDVQYGDRLSAVIDVTNRYGSQAERFMGSANISLTNANFVAEGRLLTSIPSSWLVSARRTYYDLLLKQTDDAGNYPSFTDVQGIFHIQPNAASDWTLTLMGNKEGTDLISEEEVIDDADPNKFDADDDQSNVIAGLNGSHLIGNTMRWSYTLSFTRNKQVSAIDFLEGETHYRTQADQNLNNENISFQTQYEIFLEQHSLIAGLYSARSNNDVTFAIDTEDPRVDIPDDLLKFGITQDFDKAGGFIQDTWAFHPKLEWKLGLRWDLSTLSDMNQWSPRTSIHWAMNDRWAFRGAWGYYYQFPSYETLQGEGYFLDLRTIKALHLKPEQAVHYVVSTEYQNPNRWGLEASVYYKELDNILDSGEEPETVLILNDDDQTEYYTRDSLTYIPENSREGFVRGFDLTFTMDDTTDRPYYSMLTYTYSEAKSKKRHEDYHWEDWDRRHGITWIAGWVINKRWELGWKWSLGSGFPYTPVTKIIRVVDDLDQDGFYDPDDGETFSYQRDEPDSALRSDRMPVTHRLDFRVQYSRQYRKIEAMYYLDIINIYATKNVYDYYYNVDFSKRYEDTGLPFLPSFGVKIKF